MRAALLAMILIGWTRADLPSGESEPSAEERRPAAEVLLQEGTARRLYALSEDLHVVGTLDLAGEASFVTGEDGALATVVFDPRVDRYALQLYTTQLVALTPRVLVPAAQGSVPVVGERSLFLSPRGRIGVEQVCLEPSSEHAKLERSLELVLFGLSDARLVPLRTIELTPQEKVLGLLDDEEFVTATSSEILLRGPGGVVHSCPATLMPSTPGQAAPDLREGYLGLEWGMGDGRLVIVSRAGWADSYAVDPASGIRFLGRTDLSSWVSTEDERFYQGVCHIDPAGAGSTLHIAQSDPSEPRIRSILRLRETDGVFRPVGETPAACHGFAATRGTYLLAESLAGALRLEWMPDSASSPSSTGELADGGRLVEIRMP